MEHGHHGRFLVNCASTRFSPGSLLLSVARVSRISGQTTEGAPWEPRPSRTFSNLVHFFDPGRAFHASSQIAGPSHGRCGTRCWRPVGLVHCARYAHPVTADATLRGPTVATVRGPPHLWGEVCAKWDCQRKCPEAIERGLHTSPLPLLNPFISAVPQSSLSLFNSFFGAQLLRMFSKRRKNSAAVLRSCSPTTLASIHSSILHTESAARYRHATTPWPRSLSAANRHLRSCVCILLCSPSLCSL